MEKLVIQYLKEVHGEQGCNRIKETKEVQAAIKIVNLLCEADLTIKEAAWVLRISNGALEFTPLVAPESR